MWRLPSLNSSAGAWFCPAGKHQLWCCLSLVLIKFFLSISHQCYILKTFFLCFISRVAGHHVENATAVVSREQRWDICTISRRPGLPDFLYPSCLLGATQWGGPGTGPGWGRVMEQKPGQEQITVGIRACLYTQLDVPHRCTQCFLRHLLPLPSNAGYL